MSFLGKEMDGPQNCGSFLPPLKTETLIYRN